MSLIEVVPSAIERSSSIIEPLLYKLYTLLNAEPPNDIALNWSAEFTFTVFNEVQSKNASSPMLVKLCGIFMLVNAVPLNAELPKVVIDSGSVTLAKPVQPLNAEDSIVVRLVAPDKFTVVKEVQPLNAEDHIVVRLVASDKFSVVTLES